MIVGGIAHLNLSGTEHVARIRSSRNGTEDMAVEDVHVGHADDITLLTAAIYEVGRNAARQELASVHLWVRALHVIAETYLGVAVYVALHAIAGAIHVQGGIFCVLCEQTVGFI